MARWGLFHAQAFGDAARPSCGGEDDPPRTGPSFPRQVNGMTHHQDPGEALDLDIKTAASSHYQATAARGLGPDSGAARLATQWLLPAGPGKQGKRGCTDLLGG